MLVKVKYEINQTVYRAHIFSDISVEWKRCDICGGSDIKQAVGTCKIIVKEETFTCPKCHGVGGMFTSKLLSHTYKVADPIVISKIGVEIDHDSTEVYYYPEDDPDNFYYEPFLFPTKSKAQEYCDLMNSKIGDNNADKS